MMNEDQNGSTALVPTTEQALRGQVAQILNEREIAINIGTEQGVRTGMKFAVLSDKPTEIYDPENGELLDRVDREKTRVEAVEVRPRITICRTYRTRRVGGESLSYLLGSGRYDAPRQVVETLKFTDESYLPPLSPAESYVKIKDRVVHVSG